MFNSVTKYVGLIDDNVTDVDSNTEFDPRSLGNLGVPLCHLALDFYSATHSI